MTAAKLITDNLTIGYDHPLLSGLGLTAKSGEFVCLMGPNGSGKSTLLRTLATLLPPLQGSILVDSQSLFQLGAREKARLISLVLTEHLDLGYLRVIELVAMGRYPHTGWRGRLQNADKEAVEQALNATGLQDLAMRPVQELSDGQRQKALIARALAQDGSVMLLDEPLIHLDVGNKWEVMNLLRITTRNFNKVLLMATHEIDLCLQFADKLWLITREGRVAVGCPEDLVLTGQINDTFDQGDYKFHLHQESQENGSGPQIQISGSGRALEWTRRGLVRAGYQPVQKPAWAKVMVTEEQHIIHWTLELGENSLACSSVEKVIVTLGRYIDK